jgi:hypothetical protein
MTTAALQQDIVCYMCHYTYYHYSPNTLYIIRVSSHLPSFHVVHASAVQTTKTNFATTEKVYMYVLPSLACMVA